MAENKYTEDSIKSLDWKEHIRLRPGMYIGKLGDGSASEDGIYILLKEVIDNSIDEFVMGNGQKIEINISEQGQVAVRDYGRGIPLGKLKDCASKINTGGKYDSEAFKKSVGLNGVGIKAVNALSTYFKIEAFRDGKKRAIEFSEGNLVSEDAFDQKSDQPNGTSILFNPDPKLFNNFNYRLEFVENMVRYYSYLNRGLNVLLNGRKFKSKGGLFDLLTDEITEEIQYPIIHLSGEDIEIAFTHTSQYGEDYFSFVNGQNTTQHGTHVAAFKESIVKTIRDFYKKSYEAVDVRSSIIAAVSVKIQEPVFESQTKTKLGSLTVSPDGETVRTFINNFIKNALDNFLHKNRDTAKAIQEKIQQSEKERKELKGIQKIAKERAKKAKIHNRKLRDCRSHYNTKKEDANESTIFITEGDSASGSITKSRNVHTQAVFSLKGKPLNCFGLTKKIVYENEEFNLLQNALNIEDSMEDLRYNKIILATDADVDGMHIRLLMLTFFLQFFPDLIRSGHLYILQTPLFRVRNKKKTVYCYSEKERITAIASLGPKPEITRFKGLGEISPDEFKHFIGKEIRLAPVLLNHTTSIKEMLTFYMGKNTQDRQRFIIDNLKIEQDLVEDAA